MVVLLDNPLLGIAIVLFLAFIDYPLTNIARNFYRRYMSRYIEYETVGKRDKNAFSFVWFATKIVIGFLLYIIWAIYHYSDVQIAGICYLWLLGFAMGSYFVIDLRHVESILLSRLYHQADSVSGKVNYHTRLSMRISAVQLFSIFLIFSGFLLIIPAYFTLGLACAPLFLVIRNLLIS
jgi:hypothetical protein